MSKRGPKVDPSALAFAKVVFRRPAPLPPGGCLNGLALMAAQSRPTEILDAVNKIANLTDAAAAAFFKKVAGVVSRGDHRGHEFDLLALEVERAYRAGSPINASEFIFEGRCADPKKVGMILRKLRGGKARRGRPRNSGN